MMGLKPDPMWKHGVCAAQFELVRVQFAELVRRGARISRLAF